MLGEIVCFRSGEIVVDLIVLDMQDFDIILYIDFLSHYRAKIGCKKNKVHFQMKNEEEFSFDKCRVLTMMISNLKAKKILMKGCSRYLAHVVSKPDETALSLQSALMIFEFPYVFPNKLLRLAPKREVKFSIELALGTMPIFKASYKWH